MKKLVVLMFLFIGSFISSCSTKLIVPFEEEKVCVKGVEYGYCGRISDVYEDTIKRPYRYGVRQWR